MKKIKAILTIDDGPSCDMKMKIDYLFQKSIPAIWFCRGSKMEQNPDDVIYAIKKGFMIGNHSYTHPQFTEINFNESVYQIKKTDRIIDSLCYQAGIKRPVKLFRFPGGFRPNGNKLQSYLKKIGYARLQIKNLKINPRYEKYFKSIDLMWTFDVEDYKTIRAGNKCPETSENGIIKRIDGYFSSPQALHDQIILMHDHKETTKIFIKIIDCLLKKNINLINIYKLLKKI